MSYEFYNLGPIFLLSFIVCYRFFLKKFSGVFELPIYFQSEGILSDLQDYTYLFFMVPKFIRRTEQQYLRH